MHCRSSFLGAVTLVAALATSEVSSAADWLLGGNDVNNSRNQSSETTISPTTAANLKLKWTTSTAGDVTANPAIDGDYLYFPDSAGFLYKVYRVDGSAASGWPISLPSLLGIPGENARGTPAVAGDLLILGSQSGKLLGPSFGQPYPHPAHVFAISKTTGTLVWDTVIDSTALSFVTTSPMIVNGLALVGTASNEELVAGFTPAGNYPPFNFQFRGSAVALNVTNGSIVWQTYTVPEGYHGGSIWGGMGAVDPAKGIAYAATGNNMAVPQAVLDCVQSGKNAASCLDAHDHFDSILALNLTTGGILWAAHGLGYDTWNVGCGLYAGPYFSFPPGGGQNVNCPIPSGPDWDFAQGPMLFPAGKTGTMLVGAGEKSGRFWAFNPQSGTTAWTTQVAPGGLTGGLQWGSATDGVRVYVAVSNAGMTGSGLAPGTWTLSNQTATQNGGWAALDPKTGNVLWTTPDPNAQGNPNNSRAEGAVSVANGVVFGCDLNGTMVALNASTGSLLWRYDTNAPCSAGASIADGVVYWGSGTFRGTGTLKLYAFGF